MTDSPIEPIVWSSPNDTCALWERVERDGLCWARMPGASQLALHAPERLVEIACGTAPLAAFADRIDARAGDDTRLRIEPHPLLPPALNVLVCVREATVVLVDSWRILAELDARGSSLFDRLFETHRVVQFRDFAWCAPTFSLRAKQLVCVHNGFPRESDPVGIELQRELERARPIRLRLAPGDLLVVNNHRVLRGKIACDEAVRVAAWLDSPLPAPSTYVATAARIALRTEVRAHHQAPWIRKRLGFTGKLPDASYDRDDMLAYYRGELVETLSDQARLARAYREATKTRARLTPPPTRILR